MKTLTRTYRKIENHIVNWMIANGILLLRVSLGIVFLWFGALKFLPGGSPAEHGVPGLWNLFGIESPGLTAALALGEEVAGLVRDG